MTTLEALASRVDVYSIDEAFLDLTGIDRVVSFEPFGRQAIWLKVESPDGYDTTVNACACCRLTPRKPTSPGATPGTVAKLAMRQPFVLFKGLTFQKLCL
ncbi:hypothetical protein, partial [Escherichia coli]|uniref:hypothetical protein n=1 Tax=Escherichia coli TaxID=562 RepID=UPI0039896403